MRKRVFMTMAAAAIILAGCHKDEATNSWNNEIRLSSGVTVQPTRAMYGQDIQIKSGEQVSVWVDDHTAATQLYGNNVLTADGNGGFTGGTPMYYPATGANVDVYAIHTFPGAISGTGFPAAAIVHAVATDQSDADKYAPCDLLYAIEKDQPRRSDALPLTFYHMLSKVEVALKAGDGAPDLTGAVVTILNTKLKADFTPRKDAAMADPAARAGMVAPTAADNPATPIKIATKTTANNFGVGTEYGEAILVPQTLAKGTPFIKVTLATGVELVYEIDDAEGLTLKSGTKHVFKVIAKLSSLTVTSVVEDWEAVNAKEGEATMN